MRTAVAAGVLVGRELAVTLCAVFKWCLATEHNLMHAGILYMQACKACHCFSDEQDLSHAAELGLRVQVVIFPALAEQIEPCLCCVDELLIKMLLVACSCDVHKAVAC
jgi:hypothetical protein